MRFLPSDKRTSCTTDLPGAPRATRIRFSTTDGKYVKTTKGSNHMYATAASHQQHSRLTVPNF
eukprot:255814-Pyramimonas_sp.AAC.1